LFEIVEIPDENGHKMDKILASDPLPGFFRLVPSNAPSIPDFGKPNISS